MRWLLGILIVLASIVGVAYIAGGRMPAEHTATATIVVGAPQAAVWQRIGDVAATRQWRKSVKSVTMLAPKDGKPCWIEDLGRPITVCLTRQLPQKLRIVSVANANNFFGSWSFLVQPESPTTTRVTITEDATLPSPFLRAGSALVGADWNQKAYLKDLANSFPTP